MTRDLSLLTSPSARAKSREIGFAIPAVQRHRLVCHVHLMGRCFIFRLDTCERMHIGVQLDTQEIVKHYTQSKRRLLVLGYTVTFTA